MPNGLGIIICTACLGANLIMATNARTAWIKYAASGMVVLSALGVVFNIMATQ